MNTTCYNNYNIIMNKRPWKVWIDLKVLFTFIDVEYLQWNIQIWEFEKYKLIPKQFQDDTHSHKGKILVYKNDW